MRGPGKGARSKPVLTTVFTRWRSLKPCARQGERSILREAPQGRSGKMWSESTLLRNARRDRGSRPQCSASRRRPLLGKKSAPSPFFPSSKRSRPARSGPELARAATQLQGRYDGHLPEVLAEVHGPAAVAQVLLIEGHGEGAISVRIEQGNGGTGSFGKGAVLMRHRFVWERCGINQD